MTAETFTGPGDYTGHMPDADTDAAPCRKCTAHIDPSAQRCPSCGYDSDPGILQTLVFWFVAVPWSFITGALVFGALAGVVTGMFAPVGALGTLAFAGVLGAFPWWFGVRYLRRRRRPAAEVDA